ncbi:branched-chain amino acid ABC transporter permease [Gemmobacter fulvus]|uniref:branched-chain amino acid ABC transporter permease n=1 Tax=Gemmobacter fulvus TaxID=2840474 RepID=UPI0027963E96|nr:branched-chain amino acid ABC transporter permease [Gemmobacter fulvus]MDQ1850747.1 branched-chain amino acid ABC transporter permease [Gemmobacter fulvus]
MELLPHLLLALLESAVNTSILALTALGLSLVFGVMRVSNMAHGEFFMLGAVITYLVSTVVGSPFWAFAIAVVAAPLAVGAIAYVFDFLVLQRIKYQQEKTIVATIALLYLAQQSVLSTVGPDARSVEPPVYFLIPLPWFGISGHKLVVVVLALLLLLCMWLFLKRSRIGLYMRATQDNMEMAQAFGVPVRRLYAIVFATGAMIAALAAVLVVPIQQAHYLMGQNPLMMSFIVVILGGLGSIRGTLLAAALVGFGDGMVSVLVSPLLAKIVVTLIVAFVLIARPQGLFAEKTT